MAAERTLEMLLLARDKASQVFGKVEGKFKSLRRAGELLKSTLGFITKAMAVVGAAMTLGVVALAKFASAAEVQRLAVNKLELGLKNIGKFTPEASEEMQKFASALQQVTTTGDEAILTGAALLTTLGGLSGEGLKKATVAALDLSAAIGIDFQTASNLLARAAAGNTSALTRYGLTIEQTGDKQQDFQNLLTLISERMGGSASLATDSFTGKVTQLKNAWGDAVEQLGQGANESERLQEIIVKLTEFIQKNGDAIVAFGVKIADFAATAIEFLIDKFLNVRQELGKFVLAMSEVADRMATMAEKINLPTEGLRAMSGEAAQLAVSLFQAQTAIDETRANTEALTEAITEERDAMLEANNFVDATSESMEVLAFNTRTAVEETVEAVEEFVPAMMEAGEAMGTGFANSVSDAIAEQQPEILATVQDTIDEVQDSLVGLTTQVETTRAGLIAGITRTFGLVIGAGQARTLEEFTAATRAAVGFADGGIVTRPMQGLVGEAGPEAIIPLSRLGNILGGGGGGDVNITFTGPLLGSDTDARLFAERIIDFIDEENARR